MTTIEREHVAPVVAPVTTRDVLHRAADLLEEFGWCQRSYGSKADQQFCAIGAINEARREFGEQNVAGPGEPGHHDWAYSKAGILAFWNDEPGRTKAEVVARLREAAETA